MRRDGMGWVICGLLSVACGDDHPEINSESYEFQGAIHTVVINAGSGSVVLTGKAGSLVSVSFSSEGGDSFQFEEVAGRLSVGSLCQDGTLGCGTDVAVLAPPGTDFEIFTDSGPVTVTGMDVIGRIETTSGAIFALDLGPMILSTRSLSGDHQVTFDEVPLEVEMEGGQSGALSLEVPQGDYQLDISAGGTIQTSGIQDGPSGPELTLSTNTGDVTVTGR
ncbi:MAG TPA: hypothetical protein ENK18_20950 [Deltaproteobacteria bacterium]|nr:hypothetical protein [Deltaproteobacteria bacterium]